MKKMIIAVMLLGFSSEVLAGNCDGYSETATDGSSCGLRSHDSRVAPSEVEASATTTYTTQADCDNGYKVYEEVQMSSAGIEMQKLGTITHNNKVLAKLSDTSGVVDMQGRRLENDIFIGDGKGYALVYAMDHSRPTIDGVITRLNVDNGVFAHCKVTNSD